MGKIVNLTENVQIVKSTETGFYHIRYVYDNGDFTKPQLSEPITIFLVVKGRILAQSDRDTYILPPADIFQFLEKLPRDMYALVDNDIPPLYPKVGEKIMENQFVYIRHMGLVRAMGYYKNCQGRDILVCVRKYAKAKVVLTVPFEAVWKTKLNFDEVCTAPDLSLFSESENEKIMNFNLAIAKLNEYKDLMEEAQQALEASADYLAESL